MPHLAKLLESGNNPSKVMQRRNSKSADYTRYFSLVESKRPVERIVQQSAKDFVALHTQLIEELPAFIEGFMRIFDLVVIGFSRAQARYHAAVRDGLTRYMSEQLRQKATRRLSGNIATNRNSTATAGGGIASILAASGAMREVRPADGSVFHVGDEELQTTNGIVQAWKEAWAPYAHAMDHLESTRPGELAY
jgi:hypothetical protein